MAVVSLANFLDASGKAANLWSKMDLRYGLHIQRFQYQILRSLGIGHLQANRAFFLVSRLW